VAEFCKFCGIKVKLDQVKNLSDDYLQTFCSELMADEIARVRAERDPWPSEKLKHYQPFLESLTSLDGDLPQGFSGSAAAVEIGQKGLSSEKSDALEKSLRLLGPWKKGPFKVFDHYIDAEWRSDWKWQRIAEAIDTRQLKGAKVADVGCGNGYFMFRMAEHEPKLVVGFDPYIKYWLQFQFLNSFARQRQLYFELLGAEHTAFYPEFFDVVFCLGVLYHHTDPMSLLRAMHKSLKPGGQLIVECQGIPGDEPVALCPESRYARARGIWFLPTASCLQNWLHRAGFRKIECFFAEALSTKEQRRSNWADIDSLESFLAPGDPSRTVEGYPAPWRLYMKALR